jgi:hypothetical protein
MPNDRFPNDPYDVPLSSLSDENRGQPQRFNEDLQIDPQLQEGRASTGKVVMFAVAFALILGAVFYGLNNTSVKEAQTTPPAQTAQTQNGGAPAAPPGMRDVTPRANNTEPGTTTGSATNRPTPPQSAPQGVEIDNGAKQPSNGNDNK